jgi:vanillate monooxygenase
MFLQNAWYVAARDHELRNQPLARKILNQNVVLYRAASGSPVALEDRCCHRGAPLSAGAVCGNDIQCGYHGMVFDPAGRCVRVPSQDTVPSAAVIRSYPIAERFRWLWIWMGDPQLADQTLIPNLYWHDHRDWRMIGDYFHVNCHYQSLIDIQLDNTHSKFVHPTSLGNSGAIATPPRIRKEAKTLHGARLMPESDPPPIWRAAANYKLEKADHWLSWIYHPPGTITFDVGIAEPGTGAFEGNRSRGITIYNSHGITPESDRSTHHFWTSSRNFRLEDEALTATLGKIRDTFLEDVAMVEAQQRTLEAFPSSPMVDITADAPTIQARKLLASMVELERSSSKAPLFRVDA